MHIINQSVELIKHDIPAYQLIEKAARTCYKSEDKITEGSAEKLVQALAKSKHYTTFEHEYLYFWLSDVMFAWFQNVYGYKCKYINFARNNYMSGSIRAWIELFDLLDSSNSTGVDNTMMWLAHNEISLLVPKPTLPQGEEKTYVKLISKDEVENAKDLSDKDKMVLLPHTLRFTTTRAVANEAVRHRIVGISQESQRYVDYGSNDHQITVIKPMIEDGLCYEHWHYAMLMAECQYMQLRQNGIKPEIARGVLPNDCKTELVMTATEKEWQHIVNLRYHGTTGIPHPQMRELMGMAYPILHEESHGRIS